MPVGYGQFLNVKSLQLCNGGVHMILFVSIDSHSMKLISLLCVLDSIDVLAILAAHLIAMLCLLSTNVLDMLAGKLLLVNAVRRHFLQRIDIRWGTNRWQGCRSHLIAVISNRWPVNCTPR